MTHPGRPRDVDLGEWLNGIGFKPANTEVKQLGHEMARQIIARFGQQLHYLLPAGRDKSIVFTKLDEILMWANRALAVGGGPNSSVTAGSLRAVIEEMGVALPEDPRIAEYQAQQRGETPRSSVLDDLPLPVPDVVKEQAAGGLPTPAERAERMPLQDCD